MKKQYNQSWVFKPIAFTMRFKEAQEASNVLRKVLAKKTPFTLNLEECGGLSRLLSHLNLQLNNHLTKPGNLDDAIIEKELKPKTLRRRLKAFLQKLVERI